MILYDWIYYQTRHMSRKIRKENQSNNFPNSDLGLMLEFSNQGTKT